MASVFTKIIRGEIPSYKVAEDENYIAILDAFPIVKGHTLVIPKKEVDKIYELDEQTYTGLMLFARRVARAIERAVPCIRVGVSVVGLDVHHVHVHLLPLNGPSDMDLNREKLSLTPDQMQQVADEIAAQLDKSPVKDFFGGQAGAAGPLAPPLPRGLFGRGTGCASRVCAPAPACPPLFSPVFFRKDRAVASGKRSIFVRKETGVFLGFKIQRKR